MSPAVPALSRSGAFSGWTGPCRGSCQVGPGQRAGSRPRAQVWLKGLQKKAHEMPAARQEAETEREGVLPWMILNKAFKGAL